MNPSALLALLATAAPCAAQQLTLSSQFVSAPDNWVRYYSSWTGHYATVAIPLGPVGLPYSSPYNGGSLSLNIDRVGSLLAPALRLTEIVREGYRGGDGMSCMLRTTASMPQPARVPVTLVHTNNPAAVVFNFQGSAMVDLGADQVIEYARTFPDPAQTVTAQILVDARGTDNVWAMLSDAGPGSMLSAYTSTLELQFTEPVQEASYGPACAGELGCQLDPNDPYARTFVASFPGDAVLAWLFASDRQLLVPVPGIACPLLCAPVIVVAVPLQRGAHDRQFAVLDAVLPNWPGMTWFAQGVAATGATFVGTNGVRIQT